MNIATGGSSDPPAGTPPQGSEHRGLSGNLPEKNGGSKSIVPIQWYWILTRVLDDPGPPIPPGITNNSSGRRTVHRKWAGVIAPGIVFICRIRALSPFTRPPGTFADFTKTPPPSPGQQ